MDILNDILACVSVTLDGLFPDIPVFTELVPKELPKRCFILSFAGETQITHALGSRYEVNGKLDIAYLSPRHGEGLNRELNGLFAAMALKLRHVAHGDLRIRLGSHNRRDVDDVLHDICAFKTYLYELNSAPHMQKIKAKPTNF